MSSDWDDDDIGFGKPPRWSRFRKGESGNPKGRPRKQPARDVQPVATSEADASLRKALDRKVRITNAKGSKTVKMSDAVVLAQVNKAAQGDMNAQRDVRKAQLELEHREALREEVERRDEAEKRERSFEFGHDLKDKQEQHWQLAAQQGCEPTEPWPHPEDISLNYASRTFKVRGPVAAESVPYFEYLRAEREAHFAQTIACMRSRDRKTRLKASFHARLMTIYDALLPKRWQIMEYFQEMAALWLAMPLRFVREDARRWMSNAVMLKPVELRGPISEGPTYCFVNATMKPLLKRQGYRSLAEFERAWAETGGDPPWPKVK